MTDVPFKKVLLAIEAVYKENHEMSKVLCVSSYTGLDLQYKQGHLQTYTNNSKVRKMITYH